jgi:hypothetical protein
MNQVKYSKLEFTEENTSSTPTVDKVFGYH